MEANTDGVEDNYDLHDMEEVWEEIISNRYGDYEYFQVGSVGDRNRA